MKSELQWILGSLLGLIGVPWCIWVSSSVINHKTEIAVLKEIAKDIRRLVNGLGNG